MSSPLLSPTGLPKMGVWPAMADFNVIIIGATGIATVVTAVIAIIQKNLIRAVVAYAVSSICLAALFFSLSSPYAGALELTVGAGLVAVLFLVALILGGGEEEEVAI
jgi:NADH:ubiquinone oxidoreductase subunit 6 (subunit J)